MSLHIPIEKSWITGTRFRHCLDFDIVFILFRDCGDEGLFYEEDEGNTVMPFARLRRFKWSSMRNL